MKPEVQPKKIVVLSGSGLSAESELPTFRDSARARAEKVLNCLDIGPVPFGFTFLRDKATSVVQMLTETWFRQARQNFAVKQCPHWGAAVRWPTFRNRPPPMRNCAALLSEVAK